MNLHTASEVISLARKLETDSARFYEHLAEENAEVTDVLRSFVKENAKNVIQVETAYYSVISDAIEGGFAFDMDPEIYASDIAVSHKLNKDLGKAVELEEKIMKFYSDAATQSKSLLADVPRNFTLIARKRADRIVQLKTLIEEKTR